MVATLVVGVRQALGYRSIWHALLVALVGPFALIAIVVALIAIVVVIALGLQGMISAGGYWDL